MYFHLEVLHLLSKDLNVTVWHFAMYKIEAEEKIENVLEHL